MDKQELSRLNINFRVVNETLLYGITPRLGSHLAERFKDLRVLETCGGAGFLTIELAKVAKKVITIDINEEYQNQAKHNTEIAGVRNNIEFLLGDALSDNLMKQIPDIDAAILDPVWNDRVLSHMSPPADRLFEVVNKKTQNIALILPPTADPISLNLFPPHELEKLYLNGDLALLCLYFGKFAKCKQSEFKAA